MTKVGRVVADKYELREQIGDIWREQFYDPQIDRATWFMLLEESRGHRVA